MDNPNEYDDSGFTRGSLAISEAIGTLWEAGASLDDIKTEVENGLENAGLPGNVSVDLVEID